MKAIWVLIFLIFLNFGRGYAQEHHMNGHQDQIGGQIMPAAKNLGICPVMGGEAKEEYSYVYEGKTYYFCCPSCTEDFKSDPQKYISQIKEFKLEAYQFGFEPEEIVINQGDRVTIIATSRDVAHGVYIKEYAINVTVNKGEEKKIEFIAELAGEFPILCSVYCGKGHSKMKAKLIVKE
ncbi:MAG: YHS domain-containing protein [Candidatus Omnitrophica bacterium]|nr:YHS domain-containing protein [Candidatus Omnitrophota bacterium]MBU2043638.1 YHS domain-containing protein [Candidatus Omnitrophota bacterium]MBU2265801.1 YHS domain-containing protein [Candidatus Omnitrophota bacterium]